MSILFMVPVFSNEAILMIFQCLLVQQENIVLKSTSIDL